MNLLTEMFTIFIFQMLFIIGLVYQVEIPRKFEPPSLLTCFARFVAGMTMQIKMTRELREGMDKMKYATNHSWKFKNSNLAAISGFFQATVNLSVTILNFIIIL